MANVSIGGNVTDSVLVFGNNNYVVKIGDVNGGVVNIVKPSDKPKVSARPAPVMIKPRAFPSLMDRVDEAETVKKAAELAVPVSVWGKQGIGKTSFIRHLAHILPTNKYPNGVVYLNVSSLGHEDLLQALFDAFFESDNTYKPTTADILHGLQKISALIFLDDLQIGRDETISILNAAPSSTFILISSERSFWGEGEAVQLQGLPVGDSVRLFEKELARPLETEEKITVPKICKLLQGHPLSILQSASLARESGKPLEEILNGLTNEKKDDKSMAYMGLASLTDSEKQVIALLAAAGGTIVLAEHIKGIFKGDSRQTDIQKLIQLGFVQAHSPKFSVTEAFASSLAATWDLSSWHDILLKYSIKWLSQQPASALVDESTNLLIHTIKTAGERKKWSEVIQLGRALEKFLVYYKRWQAWADILKLIIEAAKALSDSKTQAWALHQLGTRALYLGQTSEANSLLAQAQTIRKAIGDKAGLRVTQHNLKTIKGGSGCAKFVSYFVGAVVGATVLTGIAWLAINILFSPPIPIALPTATNTPTLRPSSTIPPSNTPRPSETPTVRPSRTPRPTDTPMPVLLYDFVESAHEVYWYQTTSNSDGEFTQDLPFFFEPVVPDVESYLPESDSAYVGWSFDTQLTNGNRYEKVLLTYPLYEHFKVFGDYTVKIGRPAPEAYLELTAGFKDIVIEPVEGVMFRVYVNGKVYIEEPYYFGSEPIQTGSRIRLAANTYEFRLEVESLDPSPYDFATWAVVRLWDKEP
ncbi:MAG TPA: hypothetical protein PLD33_13165 [Anaerolineales bacterium]|nr:hypothetical protein [Anaerolineales bacterium]